MTRVPETNAPADRPEEPAKVAETFVRAIGDLDDLGALEASFGRAAKALGFDQWLVNVLRPPFGTALSDTLIEGMDRIWLRHYFTQRYFEIDPVHHALLTTRLPVLWEETRAAGPQTRRHRDLVRDAEAAGVATGISLGQKIGPRGIISVSLAARHHALAPDTQQAFHLIALNLINAIKHLSADPAAPAARPRKDDKARPLTRREAEILRHLAKGEALESIAGTLKISRRTVRFHMDNVKKKYGVSTTVQAVVAALADGTL